MRSSQFLPYLASSLFAFSVSLATIHAQTFTETSIGAFEGLYDGTLFWLDVDNDDDLDLIVSGSLSTSKLYKNNGGAFTQSFGHNLPTLSNTAIASADFNNDGFADIVLTGNSTGSSNPIPQSHVYLNDGSGSFTKSTTAMLTPLYFGTVECADFDLDGDADILMTGFNKQTIAQTQIHVNNNDGTFSRLSTLSLPGVVGTYGSAATWGDYDTDGYPDILISGDNVVDNSPNRPITKIFRNLGDRTFEEVDAGLPQLNGQASWIDFNTDGKPDIFVSGLPQGFGSGESVLLLNNNNTFTEVSGLSISATHLRGHEWADFDNDGDKDLVASHFSNSEVSIYVNNGGSSLAKLTGTTFPSFEIFAAGNCDNDGDIDIILTGFDETFNLVVKAFKNNVNTTNNPPSAPTGLAASVVNGTETSLSWNVAADDETEATGLGYIIRLGTSAGADDVISPLVGSSGFIRSATFNFNSNSNSLSVHNLANGTYYARVQAVDQSFHASAASSEISFTVSAAPVMPLAPSHIVLSILPTANVEVSWLDQSSTEDNFELERSADGIAFSLLASPGKNETGYVDATVDFETQYYYRIRAVNADGISAYSSVASIVTAPKGIFRKLEGFGLPDTESNFAVAANWVDYNNDGNEDIFFGSAFTNNLLYENPGDGTFDRIPSGTLIELIIQARVYCWGDYDNDGDKDVFIATSSNNLLFGNNGDETFTQINAAPFNQDSHDTNGAAWVDYDNDGYLDLSAVNYQEATYLYHNNQDGTFTKILEGPIATDAGNFSTISWCDYDNDGWQDALVVNYAGNSIVYRNKGAGEFERTDMVFSAFSGSITSSWADYDNDGDFDVFIGHNVNEGDDFFENKGDGTFQDITNGVTEEFIQATSSGWGDADNDGHLDLILVTDKEKVLFLNNGNKDFELVTGELSLSENNYAQGVAWGDYDKDGFLDVIVANAMADNVVLRNIGNSNHWISFKLVGTETNRDAIGAKVKIKANGYWQMNYVASQTGSHGQNSFNVEFGLGTSTLIDSVVAEWPQRGFQVLMAVDADQFMTITEPSFPTAPELETVVNNELTHKADIQWSDLSASETGFFIERSVGDRYHFKAAGVTAANAVSFSETFKAEGDSVFYRVSAITSDGRGWYSNVKGILAPVYRPADVQAQPVNANDWKLTWQDRSSIETVFEIERATDGESPVFSILATQPANTTSHIDATTEELTDYLYRIRAKKGSLYSDYSDTVSIQTPLNMPLDLQIEWDALEVILTWTDNSAKESAYIIERSLSDNQHFELLAEVGSNTTTFTDDNPPIDEVLFYRVFAKNAATQSEVTEEVTALITAIAETRHPLRPYPNPADQFIVLENADAGPWQVSIVNSIGQEVVKTVIPVGAQTTIGLGSLHPGIYIIKSSGGRRLRTEKLIISR